MLNNESIDILSNIANMLRELDLKKNSEETIREVLYYIAENIDNIVFKVIDAKKLNSKKVNEYNKKNKKRHNLLNQLSYYRKTNNQAKVKELEEKLKENPTI